jgi:hypothetical protein
MQEAEEGLEELLEASRNDPQLRQQMVREIRDVTVRFLERFPGHKQQILRAALRLLDEDPQIGPELYEVVNTALASLLG